MGGRERLRLAGLVALALVLSATCLVAANWQWGRHVQRSAEMHRIESNYDAEASPIASAFASPDSPFDQADEWRPVQARGTYLSERTQLLRGRAVNGEAAFHVLVPLRIDQGPDAGALWLIDRGYVPATSDGSAPTVPAPPAGPVEVTARLQPFERANGRTPPAGQVFAITPRAAGEGQVLGGYGIVAGERPAPAETPLALPRPDIDYGNHLSYAMQWCVFAAAAPLAVFLLYRRDRRAKDGLAPKVRKQGRAEAEEDAEVERLLAGRDAG